MAAALQPDGSQVVVQFLERAEAAHLQVEPEVGVMGVLHEQVVQWLGGDVLLFRLLDGGASGGARAQVLGHRAPFEFRVAMQVPNNRCSADSFMAVPR